MNILNDSGNAPKAVKVCISSEQFSPRIRDQYGNSTYECSLAVRHALAERGMPDCSNIIEGGIQIFVEPGQESILAEVLLEFDIAYVTDKTTGQIINEHGLEGSAALDPLGFASRILSIIARGQN